MQFTARSQKPVPSEGITEFLADMQSDENIDVTLNENREAIAMTAFIGSRIVYLCIQKLKSTTALRDLDALYIQLAYLSVYAWRPTRALKIVRGLNRHRGIVSTNNDIEKIIRLANTVNVVSNRHHVMTG